MKQTGFVTKRRTIISMSIEALLGIEQTANPLTLMTTRSVELNIS